MPKIKVQRKDILRSKEILDMITAADLQMKCLIALLWAFGKRISENLAIQREEIFCAKGFLCVRFRVLKKRAKDQIYLKTLTLRHPATPFIVEYIDNIESGPLFPHLSRQLALHRLKKLNPNCYCHLFRRSLATEMSEHSFTVQQLMSWFDWSQPGVAIEYVQKGPGLTKELSNRTW